ncbi:sensor histidine kinase [Belnapia moabensis]|uniref:sensor histidine kinase n=1 Tax=Belnapia moabensis TaxID=365533 RepID=UPI000B1D7135|nr:PAS domain-containing protein [Belnapia moabensis]
MEPKGNSTGSRPDQAQPHSGGEQTDGEIKRALVAAEDARAEATAAIRERDAMAAELRSGRGGRWRAEAVSLRAKLEEAETRLARLDAETLEGRLAAAEEPQTKVTALAEELRVANEELQAQGEELARANDALSRVNQELERRVVERTAELAEANAMLRASTDTMPHLVWSSRPGGAWHYANRRWTEYTGQTAEEAAGFGWLDPVHPEDRGPVLEAWRVAVACRELRVEHRLRGRDGSYERFETRGLPLRGRDGSSELWFGTSTNVEQARRGEAALRESEARFRDFAEATADVLWVVDAETRRLEYLSPAFEAVWGVPRAEVMDDLGRWAEMLHPEDRARVLEAFPTTLTGGRVDTEYRIVRPADGQVRWVRDLGFPVRDAKGRVRRVAGLARDVTARKEAEAAQRLLLRELNHRVKNTLASVQSIAAQTARGSEAADFRTAFQARLAALAAAHDLLTRQAWQGVPLAEVVHRTLAPHAGREAGADRVSAKGPGVWLRPEAAIALHLALHELATNAAKYGALSAPGGRVEVMWRTTSPGDLLEVHWRERGGPPVRPPARRGFGSRLLERGLALQFGAKAELSFASEGVEYRLRAPLSAGLGQTG